MQGATAPRLGVALHAENAAGFRYVAGLGGPSEISARRRQALAPFVIAADCLRLDVFRDYPRTIVGEPVLAAYAARDRRARE